MWGGTSDDIIRAIGLSPLKITSLDMQTEASLPSCDVGAPSTRKLLVRVSAAATREMGTHSLLAISDAQVRVLLLYSISSSPFYRGFLGEAALLFLHDKVWQQGWKLCCFVECH